MSFDLRAVIRLDDRMSGPLRKVTANMDKTNRMAQTAGGSIKRMGDVGRSAFDRINVSAGTLLKTFAAVEVMKKTADAVGDSFNKALDFESEMSTIKALTGATNAEMKDMSELALKAGQSTAWSASESAKAIEELLKSGLSPAAVKAGALEAALNLATAGGLDLAEAASTMSTSLNAFVKDGISAADAANILAGTANASATGVHDLGYALQSVGAVAAGVGMTFKDTNAAIGLLANKGLTSGSDAGTSFKTMLQNLQPQTKDQVKLFDKLGITTNGTANKFYTAAGKVQSLDKVAGTLHESLKGLNDMQRSTALEVMFGTDAVRAATILYDEGADGVKKFYTEMGNVTALQVATEKMNNGRGAIEQFKGALETLQIRALTPLLPAIKTAFNGMADFVTNKTPQITAAIQRMVDSAKGYLNTLINDPEFNKLTSLQAKIGFVIDDIESVIGKWWTSTGQSKFEDLAAKLTSTIATGIENNAEPIKSAALKLGGTIGVGMAKGLEDSIANHPLLSMITAGAMGFKTAGPWGGVAAFTAAFGVAAKATYDQTAQRKAEGYVDPKFQPQIDAAKAWKEQYEKRATGITNVPFQNTYTLHRGEAVLAKPQAEEYRSSGGRGGGGRNVIMNNPVFNVRENADVDRIANAIALQLNAGY